MAVLPLTQLAPGMVLAKDVLDMSGRLLLGRAVSITDKHLKIFKTWGVTEVAVLDLGEAVCPSSSLTISPAFPDTRLHQQAREQALQLFQNHSHPLNQLMLTYATRAIYRRLEHGGATHVC